MLRYGSPSRPPLTRRALSVAVIAPPYLPVPPPGYGGIERVVSALVDGLARRGHQVTLVAAPGSTAPAKVVTPLATAPILGDPAAVTDELCHALALYRRAGDFDVIHDHTNLGAMIGAVAGGGAAVVHTLHGPWTAAARRMLSLLDDRVALVAISHAQRAANSDVSYAGVVHNGVDMDLHPLRTVKEDFLIFVGRTSPEKRPEVAIAVARRAGLPLKMVVKRTEPGEARYWDEAVSPLLGSDIEVLDQPPQDVKVDLMGRARALVFPIAWPEPFGLVMTESMACGTPVIARPLGAAPEVVIDGVTGFLCTTEGQMVAAVEAARSIDPETCRRVTGDRFSTDAMTRGYERVYHSLVGAGSERSRPLSAGN
ncbi:MAG TPA: glycosyltransferase family 4 protein [Acidimicrobiales bacterium]|nr:glycosyltransferase family 4 protein [Acidimicrobiales bacterium]